MYISASQVAKALSSDEELHVKQEEQMLKIPFLHSAQTTACHINKEENSEKN